VNTGLVHKSKDDFKATIFIFLSIAIVLFIVAIVVVVNIVADPFWDISQLVIGIVLFGVAGYLFYSATNFYSLEIYSDKVVATPPFRLPAQQLFYSDITHWIERERQFKHNKVVYELTLFTANGNLTISSDWYTNYPSVKTQITCNLPTGSGQSTYWSGSTAQCVIMFLVGTTFLLGAYVSSGGEKLPFEYSKVNGTLISEPVTIKPRKGSYYIHVQLEEYPGFTFTITGQQYKNMDVLPFVSKAQMGKPFQVEISTTEYEAKITKVREPTFMEAHSGYDHIKVYGCRDAQYIYLVPDLTHTERENDWGVWIMLIIGISLTTNGIHAYVHRDW